MSEMLDSLNEQIAMMSGMLGGIAGFPSGSRSGRYEHHAGVSHRADKEIGIRKSLWADKEPLCSSL